MKSFRSSLLLIANSYMLRVKVAMGTPPHKDLLEKCVLFCSTAQHQRQERQYMGTAKIKSEQCCSVNFLNKSDIHQTHQQKWLADT